MRTVLANLRQTVWFAVLPLVLATTLKYTEELRGVCSFMHQPHASMAARREYRTEPLVGPAMGLIRV